MLERLTEKLAAAKVLDEAEVRAAVEKLVDETVPATLKAEFLCALALKGETVGEIAAFARALQEKAVAAPLDEQWRREHEILDVCGTGGDRLNTFNISTTVALVCSAAGVPVAKHGNRAITSQAGSADVLEELGFKIDLSPAQAARALQEHNFAFFFAPNYHPSFRHIGAARKLCAERKQRTIFNFLGPLLNPARPTAQLVGVPRPELCQPMAEVLRSLGGRRGMVVCGHVTTNGGARGEPGRTAFLDEFSSIGANTVAEFYQSNAILTSTYAADAFCLQPGTLADLAGGDRKANAEIVRRILRGEDRGPKREAVLLNSGAALFVSGRVKTIFEGWEMGGRVIDTGQAAAKLKELLAVST